MVRRCWIHWEDVSKCVGQEKSRPVDVVLEPAAESCDVGVAVVVLKRRAAHRRSGRQSEGLTAENPVSLLFATDLNGYGVGVDGEELNVLSVADLGSDAAVWRHLDEKDGHDQTVDFVLCFVAGLKILGVTFRILHCGPFER